MIFKIQRPLGGDMTQMLVYNQDHSVEFMMPFDDDAKAFMGVAVKKYAHCHIKDGKLHVEQEVAGESW